MRPCVGCRYLVILSTGRGVCRWPERHGGWDWTDDPLTGRLRPVFFHADGRVEMGAVARRDVHDERTTAGHCGPEARHYEPTYWRRFLRRLFG